MAVVDRSRANSAEKTTTKKLVAAKPASPKSAQEKERKPRVAAV